MLTTGNSREVERNVITDVNANVAAPETPARRTLSPEAALLFDKSIVARPLMVPEVCSIRVKDHTYRYRWVNKAGRNGAIYMQRKAQGFMNATTEDVEVMGGDASATNSEITAGDVILMKIGAERYDAAMKYNMEKAMVMQRTRGMHLKGASSDVMSDSVAERVSISQEKGLKNNAFIPENPEALFAGSDPELARAQSDEIRENIKSGKANKVEAKKE